MNKEYYTYKGVPVVITYVMGKAYSMQIDRTNPNQKMIEIIKNASFADIVADFEEDSEESKRVIAKLAKKQDKVLKNLAKK